MIRIQKVLYATDFSSFSNQAYFHAVSLAEKHHARLTVLFVFHPERVLTPGSKGDIDADRAYWKAQLEQIRPLNPGITVEHVMLEGDPADEIVRHARQMAADLIVMGTQGRTGLDRLLLGSVAEKVLRDAACSVLVVKLPKGTASEPRAR
jgi:nucleotide-binding universal stress UspA family protein